MDWYEIVKDDGFFKKVGTIKWISLTWEQKEYIYYSRTHVWFKQIRKTNIVSHEIQESSRINVTPSFIGLRLVRRSSSWRNYFVKDQ